MPNIKENIPNALPCPFCGSHDTKLDVSLLFTRCDDCDATGPFVNAIETNLDKHFAIRMWNVRAN